MGDLAFKSSHLPIRFISNHRCVWVLVNLRRHNRTLAGKAHPSVALGGAPPSRPRGWTATARSFCPQVGQRCCLCCDLVTWAPLPGRHGEDPDPRPGRAGHHLPGAERDDCACCRQPSRELPGAAAPEQAPESSWHQVCPRSRVSPGAASVGAGRCQGALAFATGIKDRNPVRGVQTQSGLLAEA